MIDPDERDDLLYEQRRLNRYESKLYAHPDCRDPEHPGCIECEPENFDLDFFEESK